MIEYKKNINRDHEQTNRNKELINFDSDLISLGKNQQIKITLTTSQIVTKERKLKSTHIGSSKCARWNIKILKLPLCAFKNLQYITYNIVTYYIQLGNLMIVFLFLFVLFITVYVGQRGGGYWCLFPLSAFFQLSRLLNLMRRKLR